MADNWKWTQTANKALEAVGGFFNTNVGSFKTVKDAPAKKILKQADESTIQVKRTRDVVNATRRTWRNQIKISGMIHGLVREGLKLIGKEQKEEANTSKALAQAVTSRAVLNTRTRNSIEQISARGQSQIRQSQHSTNLALQEITDAEGANNEQANQASQQRRSGYRDRVQRRIAAGQTPWRNY